MYYVKKRDGGGCTYGLLSLPPHKKERLAPKILIMFVVPNKKGGKRIGLFRGGLYRSVLLPPVFLPLPEVSRVVMFDLGIDSLVRRDGGGCTVSYFFLSLHKKRIDGGGCMVQLYMYSYILLSLPPYKGVAPKIYSCMHMLCIVMFNLGVFAVFCFYFAGWGLYNLYFLLTSWLTAMGLSALMDASVLKATGSSALFGCVDGGWFRW